MRKYVQCLSGFFRPCRGSCKMCVIRVFLKYIILDWIWQGSSIFRSRSRPSFIVLASRPRSTRFIFHLSSFIFHHLHLSSFIFFYLSSFCFILHPYGSLVLSFYGARARNCIRNCLGFFCFDIFWLILFSLLHGLSRPPGDIRCHFDLLPHNQPNCFR